MWEYKQQKVPETVMVQKNFCQYYQNDSQLVEGLNWDNNMDKILLLKHYLLVSVMVQEQNKLKIPRICDLLLLLVRIKAAKPKMLMDQPVKLW